MPFYENGQYGPSYVDEYGNEVPYPPYDEIGPDYGPFQDYGPVNPNIPYFPEPGGGATWGIPDDPWTLPGWNWVGGADAEVTAPMPGGGQQSDQGQMNPTYTQLPSRPVQPGQTQQPKSLKDKLLDALLKPETLASVLSGGLGLAGNILRTNADRAIAAAEDKYKRSSAFMDSTQLNPVTQQQDLFRAAMIRALAERGPSRLGEQKPYDTSQATPFLSNPALQQASERFYQGQYDLNPNIPKPNYATMGFGQPQQASMGQGPISQPPLQQQAGQPQQQGKNPLKDYFNRMRNR